MRTAAAIDWLRLQQPRRRMASTRQHPPAGPNRSARCGARPARETWRGCAAALRTCFVRGGRCRVTAGAAVAVCGGCTTPPRCRPPAARSAGSIATSTIGLPDGRQDKTSIWISSPHVSTIGGPWARASTSSRAARGLPRDARRYPSGQAVCRALGAGQAYGAVATI
jgi:hypothetical protein